MKNWSQLSSGGIMQKWVLPILLLSLLLSGCSTLFDPESSQEFNSDQVGLVNSTTQIGQLITSRHSRINGITLWLSRTNLVNNSSPNRLTVIVYQDQASEKPLTSTSISTASITQYTPVQISLPPITLSGKGTFYIELSSNDEIIVHGRVEDSYPGGQAYQNRVPLNADIAFRVTYLYDEYEFADDIQKIISSVGLIIPLLGILLLPGYAIVRIFGIYKIYPATLQLAFSVGFSLALIPLIYLFGSEIGYKITSQHTQLILLLSFLIIIISWLSGVQYKTFIMFFKEPKQAFLAKISNKTVNGIINFTVLISILSLSFTIRMIMIRDLATPAWVDSIHHGLITRLILENGSLPDTYLPYLDIETTLYHPGFHSTLAAFISISGVEIPLGMLLFGQVLNATMALSVHLLAVALTRKPIAGLLAALMTSAFMAMPAYYTSWGRYPQLTGLIILPIPVVLMIAVKNQSPNLRNNNLIVCAALAMAGLLLVHYRVAAFIACLFLSWLIVELIASRAHARWLVKFLLLKFSQLTLMTFALAFLWFIPVIRDTVLPRINPQHTETSIAFFSDFSWDYLTPIFGKQVIVLAILGVIWGLINKQKVAAVITIWIILLFLVANFDALHLPGGSFVNDSSVAIMLFLPLSLMAGYSAEQVFMVLILWRQVFSGFSGYLVALIFIVATIVVSLSGAQQMVSILNPATLLSRQEDLVAIKWIDVNIPDENVILINSFPWGYGLFAGNDGGGWISTLAGNQTMPPPVLYGLGSDSRKSTINQVCHEVLRIGTSPDALWKYLTSNNINYIYIGARGGSISPYALASNPHFDKIYNLDDTWLFHILP